LTQNWTQQTVNGLRYVAVQSYVSKWIRHDTTVAWSGATMTAAAFGPTTTSVFINKVETKSVGTPTSGASYTQVPSWHSYWVLVQGSQHYQCGTNHINLAHGSRHWVLDHTHVCQGSQD